MDVWHRNHRKWSVEWRTRTVERMCRDNYQPHTKKLILCWNTSDVSKGDNLWLVTDSTAPTDKLVLDVEVVVGVDETSSSSWLKRSKLRPFDPKRWRNVDAMVAEEEEKWEEGKKDCRASGNYPHSIPELWSDFGFGEWKRNICFLMVFQFLYAFGIFCPFLA